MKLLSIYFTSILQHKDSKNCEMQPYNVPCVFFANFVAQFNRNIIKDLVQESGI